MRSRIAALRTPAVVLLAAALSLPACTRYEQKPLPIRLPSSYANAAQAFDATLAADAYDDPARAGEVFGFNPQKAGLLPVQLVFDHQGQDPIEIVPSQTFLVDEKGQLWNILDQQIAYKRIREKTEMGEIAPQAGKGAFLGAAAGAIVGAAIGIVTGGNIGEAVGKGAAVGGAGGAVVGGTQGYTDGDVGTAIRKDLRERTLENKPIPPGGLSHGVLFFPGEAQHAAQLRLQLRNTRTGATETLQLAL